MTDLYPDTTNDRHLRDHIDTAGAVPETHLDGERGDDESLQTLARLDLLHLAAHVRAMSLPGYVDMVEGLREDGHEGFARACQDIRDPYPDGAA